MNEVKIKYQTEIMNEYKESRRQCRSLTVFDEQVVESSWITSNYQCSRSKVTSYKRYLLFQTLFVKPNLEF